MDLLKEIFTKKSKNITCPNCEGDWIIKNGHAKEVQRYKCKICGKTFTLFSNTIVSGSHYKEKWGDFIKTMEESMSLRGAEEKIGVNYGTLFYWRHKIMSILEGKNEEKLKGVIEIINEKIPFLDKNNKKEKVNRGKVCITFIYERDARLDFFAYRAEFRAMDVINEISSNFDKNSTICLQANIPYKMPFIPTKLNVISATDKNYDRDLHNTDKVWNLINRFNRWKRIFNGVSSKNLKKYISYFRSNNLFNNFEKSILDSINDKIHINNFFALLSSLDFL